MNTFTTLSACYQSRATLQQSASRKLFELLAIQPAEDVLDLGCGPGHLTCQIRRLTAGAIWGLDPSAGMMAQAQRHSAGLNLTFHVGTAESLDAVDRFDVIFCNSAFQWFHDPSRALHNCYRALRAGGRFGIQAPARANYCPRFIQAVQTLLTDPRTRPTFLEFRSPWFFLETADDYAQLCTTAGLAVKACWIEEVTERCSPDQALERFESGAAAGYLNPAYYAIALPPGFIATARERIASAFHAQADPAGKVSLTFSRCYLLADKP